MPKTAIVLISLVALTWVYLGCAATLCVVLDRGLAVRVAVLRILVSWVVPMLGAIVTVRVAVEECGEGLRSRWWLWPLRFVFSEGAPERGFAEVTDMRGDAERILPGSTWIPPP
jgi:hypothetical protein